MLQPITMPALSDTMNHGRLVRWTKNLGDAVRKGETVVEIETDKALMEAEAFHDGYLAGPLTPPDTEVPVGEVIAYIADSPAEAANGAGAMAAPVAAARAATLPMPSAPNVVAVPPEAAPPRVSPQPDRAPQSAHELRASPYARRLAQQLGVDLSSMGTTAGTVHADAILEAARRSPYRVSWPSRVRESVARNMIKSLQTPTFHVAAQLPIGAIRRAADAGQLSLTLLLARAAALAVQANPLFNAAYTPEGLAFRERVDVGIAIDTPDGLIAAVLRDVAQRPVELLAADWRDLRARVSRRRLKPGDCHSATFYLSNLGTFPVVRSFDAVLPLGAAAILCVGAAEDDRVCFTLGCDHRVVAGADAARFLQSFAQLLADPTQLSMGTA
jgi:pyruvate dehydrogenase E2 component (dihydrolipoamide acetyltransferase)